MYSSAFSGFPLWSSFERLRLHLCRVFLEWGGLEVTEQTFENPEILNRASFQHEAVLLLKEAFSRLSAARQQRLLEWIDRGWSEASIRRWLEFCGQAVTDKAVEELSDIWKRDHYAVLEGQLHRPVGTRLPGAAAQLDDVIGAEPR